MTEKVFTKPNIDRNIDRIVQHPLGGPTVWTVANCLTFFRIFISPIFLYVYLQHDALGINTKTLPYILLFLLGVSELSDAFDGLLARKYNQVTDLGKILDPMADSISRISVFLTFTQPPVNVPLVCVFIFLYRFERLCPSCTPKRQNEGHNSSDLLFCDCPAPYSALSRSSFK